MEGIPKHPALNLVDATKLSVEEIAALPEEQFAELAEHLSLFLDADRQNHQIVYYRPVSEQARKFHLSRSKTVALFGGNGSSKSDTMLADMVIMSTGLIPHSLQNAYPKEKIKCPANYRITLESLTTTLYPVILPKLQWWRWDGIDPPGGKRGHWGWIPQRFLIGESWEKSWSDKLRLLRLRCGCVWQFMSYDQDPSDFASGSVWCAAHDEKPPRAIWSENRARVMRTGGYMLLAMTPPTEAGISVDWIHDDIYERGQDGPMRDPAVESIVLFTEDNPHLDQSLVAERAKQMTKDECEVRLHGKFIHLSNLIHPLFTAREQWWCFGCHTRLIAVSGDICPECGSKDISTYCHVLEDFDPKSWPTVFLLDPHPRRPHAMAWITVTPSDDNVQVAELEVDAEPSVLKKEVDALEDRMGLFVVRRFMDPNMGESPASAERRHVTWRSVVDDVGLRCDLADDNFPVGKNRINEMLRPDQRTRRPRMAVTKACPRTIHQFSRYVWDEWVRYADGRDPKERPGDKHGDFPALWRYFANANLSFDLLKRGGMVIRTRQSRKN